MSSTGEGPVAGPELDRLLGLVDSSLGAVSIVVQLTSRSARSTRRLGSPVLRGVERLPLVTKRSRALADTLHRRGTPLRGRVATTGVRLVDLVVPYLVEQALRRVDLNQVVRRHLDLDRLVADLDVDAVVDRVDLDAVAARLDVDAVAARLDIDAVLDRMDLTTLALRRLDLGRLVSAVLAEVDLVAIAEQVIEAVDLPEIIRDSSGALTSDTVRGARMRSAAADQALGRVRDRLLLRRSGNGLPAVPAVPTAVPKQPGPEPSTPPDRP